MITYIEKGTIRAQFTTNLGNNIEATTLLNLTNVAD